MVQQIAVAWADVGIGQVLVNLQRLCLHPLAVLPVESLLGNLADVDLWVEVGGEGLMVVTGIAVDDVQILHLLEVVLGSVCRVDAGDAWVEATSEDGGQTCLLELLAIGPLPRILEVSLVLGLVVGSVQVGAATGQTSLHDGQVLIGQCQIDDQLWLVAVEERLQLLHVVSVYLCCLYGQFVALLVDGLYDGVALLLAAACYHELCKHVSVLCYLERCYRCDASGANH